MPALAFLGSFIVFMGLDKQAKIYSLSWFVIGILIYLFYGMNNSSLNNKEEQD